MVSFVRTNFGMDVAFCALAVLDLQWSVEAKMVDYTRPRLFGDHGSLDILLRERTSAVCTLVRLRCGSKQSELVSENLAEIFINIKC